MRKAFFSIVFGLITVLLFGNTTFALSAPTINPVKSPYDGQKQTIRGTTVPGASVTVTGGPFQIPPVTADAQGNFSVVLSLTENNTNIFQIWVAHDGDVSDQVEVIIVESASEAAAHAAATGEDYSAPEKPVIDPVTETVDTYFYNIEGTAEPGTRIFVTGDDEAQAVVSTGGRFVAKVRLNQNKKNTFYLEAQDASENTSQKVMFTITERGESDEETDVRVVIDETTGTQSYVVEIAEPFSDLVGHPQERYIEALRLQGVLQGYPDGTVKPDTEVNRAELLKMAMLSFGLNVLNEASGSPFSDVPRYTWFARFIETGKEEGVIGGYADGSFRPEQTVNRAEALKIILESSRTPFDSHPQPTYLFTDIRETAVDQWFYPYAYFLRQNNIIFPNADGSARLNDPMTRGDLAEIIVRLQNFMNEE